MLFEAAQIETARHGKMEHTVGEMKLVKVVGELRIDRVTTRFLAPYFARTDCDLPR